MSNLAKKDHILDLSLFHVEFDEEQYISEYLAAYDAPTTIERTWLLQVAKAFSMVEVSRKSIKHVLAAHVARDLEREFFFSARTTSRPLFSLVLGQLEGQLDHDDQLSLEKVLKDSKTTLEAQFAAAMKLNVDQVAKFESLIDRQFKNVRIIMQCLEQMRIAPLLHKKLALDIKDQERRVAQLVD